MKKSILILALILAVAPANAKDSIFDGTIDLMAEPQVSATKKIDKVEKEIENIQENIKKQEASIEKITNDEADKMINNAILSVKQQKYYAKQMKKIKAKEEKFAKKQAKLKAKLEEKQLKLEKEKAEVEIKKQLLQASLEARHSAVKNAEETAEKNTSDTIKKAKEYKNNLSDKEENISDTTSNITNEKNISDKKQTETKVEKEQNAVDITQIPPVSIEKTAKDYKKQIKNAGLKFNKEEFIKQAEMNNTQMIEAFLKAGMKPDVTNESGTTPLIWASFNGNSEIVKMLIESGANVNAVNRDGFTPLHAAVESENVAIVRYLLKNGANLKTATYSDKTTPLHTACFKGNKEIAQILVVAGADVNAKNIHGATPVVTAAFYGKKGLVEYLTTAGANLDAKSEDGKILAVSAISTGKTNVFEELIDAGANVNQKDENGKTMLHAAVEKADIKTAQELLLKGADVNATFKKGENTELTPLHLAALNKDKAMVKMLLKNDADKNAKDGLNGATPLEAAILVGDNDSATILIENGADVNTLDKNNFTPADIALALKNEFLLKKIVTNGGLFGKKTGGILVPYGCSIVYNEEKDLYNIDIKNAISAVKRLEEIPSKEYNDYMMKTNSFRNERGFVLDKHAYKVYPLLFESIE